MSAALAGYKTKPNKHKYRTRNRSLEEFHDERVKEFQKRDDKIPRLKRNISDMKSELQEIENSGVTNMNRDATTRKSKLRSDIKKLEKELVSCESYEKQLEYYSTAGDVLFDYYDSTAGRFYNYADEDGETAAARDTQIVGIKISEDLRKLNASHRKKKKIQPKKRKVVRPKKANSIMTMLFGEETKKQNKTEDKTCRAFLEDRYLSIVDPEYNNGKKHMPITKCPACGSDRIVIHTEAMLVCQNPECAIAEEIEIESEVPSQKENYNEKTKYPYKRLGHFVEKLNQFLCKGTVKIPQKVYDAVESELKKYSYTSEHLTIKFLEKALRKHDLSSWYEYSMYIYCKMKKIKPLTISRSEYDMMIKMFQMMEKVYEDHYKPENRNNFLRYTVAMYRLFLLMGKDEHANSLKLLKDVNKMKEQFRIIDKIFDHLGWEYDPTKHSISQVSNRNSRIVTSKSKQNYQNKTRQNAVRQKSKKKRKRRKENHHNNA